MYINLNIYRIKMDYSSQCGLTRGQSLFVLVIVVTPWLKKHFNFVVRCFNHPELNSFKVDELEKHLCFLNIFKFLNLSTKFVRIYLLISRIWWSSVFLAAFLLDLMLNTRRGLACTIINPGMQWSSVFLSRILLDLTLKKFHGLAWTIWRYFTYPSPFWGDYCSIR